MATAAQDTEQIARTVDLYVEGCRDGDAAKLRQAFHPEARLWGSLAGQRYDEPITELIAMLDGSPVDVDGSFQARITALDQTGDAAAVTLAEAGFWGTVSFVDYFSLARIGGEWKNVNKTFVHTGGEPPPME